MNPTNILVNVDRNLKLIDFGLSRPIINEKESGETKWLKGYCGTREYLAPEIQKARENSDFEYSGDKADLFACGVILYNMVSGKKPFKDAKTSDPRFLTLSEGNYDEFWKNQGPEFTERFKTII